jgi:O-antigen ligase/polysaccharide polymerase Wzy-like membrane protein
MNTLFHSALAVIAIAVFYMNWPNYAHIRLGILVPYQWVLGFGVLSLPFLFRQIVASDRLKSPVVIWCFGYAWLTIVWFIGSSQSEVAWQVVRWRFLAIIELLLFISLFSYQEANRLARQVLVVGVATGAIIQIYELFFPMSFSEVLGRSAGLYMNPNLAGAALVAGTICAVTVLPLRYRMGFCLMSGIGVMASFSRGSILAWGIAVAGLAVTGLVRAKGLAIIGLIGFALVLLMAVPNWDGPLSTLEAAGTINKNVEERLAWLAAPTDVSDASGWWRQYIAKRAWDKIEEHPFLGGGTGSSFETDIAPHNQSLVFMQDHGVIGILILPLLLLSVVLSVAAENRRTAIVFGCTLMFVSFFSHTLLNDPPIILLLALMATMGVEKPDRASESEWVERDNLSGLTSPPG